MQLRETARGIVAGIFVKTNSRQFQVRIENGELIVYCHEVPVKGRVNRELIKELSKIFKTRVEIISGKTSRYKKILIRDIKEEDVQKALLRERT